jgi:riboflavin kinase/FMN adenylyltransferase
MQHIETLENVYLENAWLTVGSFDGVHLGHQELLENLTAGAHSVGAPAVVLTFDPHPASVLRPNKSPPFLTTLKERVELLNALGIDLVITHPFNRKVASQSAEDFLIRLKKHLGFKHFWVGHDFAMGRDREGDIQMLRRLGKKLDYELNVVNPVEIEGRIISSSRIRRLLAEGQVQEASHLLGRPYRLVGKVVEGARRGRMIGIPTANLNIPGDRAIPNRGVYVCQTHVNGKTWNSVTNVGVRPTFEMEAALPLVETHIFDFSDNLYGKDLQLDFIARLRDEQKFPNVQALVEQIQQDISRAQEFLRA